MGKIIDISHHHKVSDWKKVQSGVDVLITKATQGTGFVDDYFPLIVEECEKRGIPYWLYTYLNNGNEDAQAKFMVKTCRDVVGGHFVGYILDIEENNSVTGVKRAMDYLSALDHKMAIYTMYAQYDKYKTLISERPEKCAWWEARYGLNDGIYRSNYPCHSGVDLHQYTSAGVCQGIPDEIDLNRVTGNGKKLKWFMTPKTKKEEETMSEKKPGCFSSNKNAKGLTEFLHNRGYGAGQYNIELIAEANAEQLRKAMFELAEKGDLIKPDGLREWDGKTNKKKD